MPVILAYYLPFKAEDIYSQILKNLRIDAKQ